MSKSPKLKKRRSKVKMLFFPNYFSWKCFSPKKLPLFLHSQTIVDVDLKAQQYFWRWKTAKKGASVDYIDKMGLALTIKMNIMWKGSWKKLPSPFLSSVVPFLLPTDNCEWVKNCVKLHHFSQFREIKTDELCKDW